MANSGFWGMNIQQGETYDLSFYARTEGNRTTTLNVSLEDDNGSTVAASGKVENVGGAWKKYTLALTASATNPKARLVISQATEGTIWLDVVSLFPRKTFKGHGLRQDLAEMLADLKPGFVRFPGGCVVEGASMSSRWNWKESIGDISQRRGLYNVWGYFNTYGLGFHELLQLCEDLNAAPMYVCNVGMSCGARQPAEELRGDALQPMVQDALDALEYAMGPVTSTWGAKRAANGHPAPFKIKYLEIGNENSGATYQANYKVFYDAIKAKYPDVITIADQRIPNAPVEIVDEHYYVNPARFFGMANQYDNTPRNGPEDLCRRVCRQQRRRPGQSPGRARRGRLHAQHGEELRHRADVLLRAALRKRQQSRVGSQPDSLRQFPGRRPHLVPRAAGSSARTSLMRSFRPPSPPTSVTLSGAAPARARRPGNPGAPGARGGRGGLPPPRSSSSTRWPAWTTPGRNLSSRSSTPRRTP